jgi:hypothetical protein
MNAGIAPNQSIDNLRGFHEAHCSRVHAVAKAGWAGTVIEDVAEMSIALATGDSRPLHAQTSIGNLDDIFFGNGLPEARPAGARFKLGLRAEDCVIAADAAIKAMVVIVPGDAGKGAFCTLVPGHFKRDRRKFLLPFCFGFDDPRNGDLTGRLPSVRELDDRDSSWDPGTCARRGYEGGTPRRESSDTTGAGCCEQEGATVGTLFRDVVCV